MSARFSTFALAALLPLGLPLAAQQTPPPRPVRRVVTIVELLSLGDADMPFGRTGEFRDATGRNHITASRPGQKPVSLP